ncbi:hypothetical protein ACTHAM_001484 [Cellulomonas soli]|uniref:hypothetical protein n=1 Tax=Cellulomonas soli TaxID=931535 RepID=UPI003F84E953
MATSRRPLPVRRLVATVVGAPVLLAVLVAAGGGPRNASAVWFALVGATAVLGVLTIASFVPERGQSLAAARGCAPCSAMSLATVAGAALLLGFAPGQVTMALAALAVVAAGLLRRTLDLRSPAACPTG